MSLGYTGMCKKELEDDEMVIYSYSGENWNDGGNQKAEIVCCMMVVL